MTAGADRHNRVGRLDHIAIAGDDQRGAPVGHAEHGLQPAQHAVGAPVLGQFHGRAHEIALMFLQLGLKALKQRERVGRRAREAGQDLLIKQTPHLARIGLHHGVAQRDLAVAADHDMLAAPDREDGGAFKLLQEIAP